MGPRPRPRMAATTDRREDGMPVGPGSVLAARYTVVGRVQQHPRWERWTARDATLERDVVLLCFPLDAPTAAAALISGEIAFTHASARSPGDAFSYDVKAHRVTRWTNGNGPRVNTSEFVEPRLKLDQPGKPGFELSAKHGKLSADHDQVWFSGNVRAVREPQPGESGAAASGGRMTLATEALHVATREERLDTDQPVTIEDARGIIRGVGLEFDNVARTASLRSQVSGTLQPGSTPRKGP